MKKVKIINLKNESVKELSLNENIFNVEVNEIVLKKQIRLQLDSTRQGTHKTKSRSEVRGGGRKPWKQKGTGNARQGSIRSVQWVGGGHAHNITPRDYGFKTNRKERVLALKSALSDKAQNNNLVVVESLNIENLKTKTILNLLKDLNLNGKILFVTKDECENLFMASRNLDNVYHIMLEDLNCLDIVHNDILVMDEESMKALEEALS